MKAFVIRWLITAAAVLVAAHVVPGIDYTSWGALLGTALLLGIANAFIRPVLLLLSLPFILVTLGFFILVVNAFVLWMVSGIVPGFHVSGFGAAFFGAILVSLVSWILSAIFQGSDGRVHVITHHAQIREQGQPRQVEGRVIK